MWFYTQAITAAQRRGEDVETTKKCKCVWTKIICHYGDGSFLICHKFVSYLTAMLKPTVLSQRLIVIHCTIHRLV